MEDKKIRVAITHGDTNGVGYELIFKTFADPEMLELCTPVVYGSPKIATYHRKALDMQANFSIINDAEEARDGRVNMLPCFDEEIKVDMGTPTKESALAAVTALKSAAADFGRDVYDVVVMCPTSTAAISDGQVSYGGQDEYFAARIGSNKGLRILVSDAMRIASATGSANVKEVASLLTKETLVEKVQTMKTSLQRDFALSAPRVALLALNYNGGGAEEADVIRPVAEDYAGKDMSVFGPYSANTFFGAGQYRTFDAIMAMHADQASIPFNTLTTDDGLCFIAGLPLVVTLPSHGPRYEAAGAGTTSEQAFRQAIYTAIDAFRNRALYDEANANPLPKIYHEKREEGERQPRFVPAKERFATPPKDKGETSQAKDAR